MVAQNMLLAISLAALGGLIQVLSVLIIAWPEHCQQTRGKDYKKPNQLLLVPLNIFVQLFNGAANTGAAIFGPVAIVMPVMVSSQLLFNIIIFGYLQMEYFGKDVQVGTFIVVLGAIVLPVVGPTIQQDQDIMELLSAPWSLVWASFLFCGVVISGVCCFCCVNTKRWKSESLVVYITLVVARVFSSVLSTSLSKTLALVNGYPLMIVILGFLICGFVLGTSVVLQATKTEQKLFVPIISCATQIINAGTGLILWDDWRVVQSWAGYATVMIQIIVGVYLISSLDFFENTAEPHYGLRQTVAIRTEGSVRTMGSKRSLKSSSIRGMGGNGGDTTIDGKDRSVRDVTPATKSVSSDMAMQRRREIWEELRKKIIEEEGGNVESGTVNSIFRNTYNNDRPRTGASAMMSTMTSVSSIRGLIGGISREPSYMQYKQPSFNLGRHIPPTSTLELNLDMDILAESFEPLQMLSRKEKMMLKSIELAEEAAKNGDDDFAYEIDSAMMESVGSLTDAGEYGETKEKSDA